MNLPEAAPVTGGKFSPIGLIMAVGVILLAMFVASKIFNQTVEIYDANGAKLGEGSIKMSLASKKETKTETQTSNK